MRDLGLGQLFLVSLLLSSLPVLAAGLGKSGKPDLILQPGLEYEPVAPRIEVVPGAYCAGWLGSGLNPGLDPGPVSLRGQSQARYAAQRALNLYQQRRQWDEEFLQELEDAFWAFDSQTDYILAKDQNERVIGSLAITYAFYDKGSLPDSGKLAHLQSGKTQILPLEKILRLPPLSRPLTLDGLGVIIEFRFYFLEQDADLRTLADLHFSAYTAVHRRIRGLESLMDKPIIWTYGDRKSRAIYTALGFKPVQYSGDGGSAARSGLDTLLVATPNLLGSKIIEKHFDQVRSYSPMRNPDLPRISFSTIVPQIQECSSDFDLYQLPMLAPFKSVVVMRGLQRPVEVESVSFPCDRLQLDPTKALEVLRSKKLGASPYIRSGHSLESYTLRLGENQVEIPAGFLLHFYEDGSLDSFTAIDDGYRAGSPQLLQPIPVTLAGSKSGWLTERSPLLLTSAALYPGGRIARLSFAKTPESTWRHRPDSQWLETRIPESSHLQIYFNLAGEIVAVNSRTEHLGLHSADPRLDVEGQRLLATIAHLPGLVFPVEVPWLSGFLGAAPNP